MNESTNTLGTVLAGDANRYYVPAFHFNKKQACYCHSGKVFADCCGAIDPLKAPPKYIKVFNNFLSPTECKRFVRYAEKQKRSWLTVIDSEKSTSHKRVEKRDPSRVTQHIELGRKQEQANEWLQMACRDKLSVYGKPQWFEAPHLLRYGPGGKYNIHSDAEHYDFHAQKFYRFIDRDFSMLIYLNDDYQGGELNFPWLNYQYKPVAGDLVVFPSNHIFSHESMPIISGSKYALVSWGAFYGSPRVSQPKSIIRV